MTADFSGKVLDDYLVAQYAYWAGDFGYAQELYARAAGRKLTDGQGPQLRDRDDSLIEQLTTADDLLAFVAGRREQRIAEKQHAFDTLVSCLPAGSHDLASQPLILQTALLRGAVWRLSARAFQMRAYPTAVKHGKPVLKRAREIAQERGAVQTRQPEAEGPSKGRICSTDVYEWEEAGNPFLSIVVSRLMFIEVDVFSTGERPPSSFAAIQKRLQAVLDSLGHGTGR